MNRVDIKKAAVQLNVSDATLSNWLKKYEIKKKDGTISIEEFSVLKNAFSKKLNSRANKGNSELTFIPREYFGNNKKEIEKAEKLVKVFNKTEMSLNDKMLIVAIMFFFNKNMIQSLEGGIELKEAEFKNKNLYKEFFSWKKDKKIPHKVIEEIRLLEMPDAEDFLGAMYQSFLSEGDKAKLGSYYTPLSEVKKIVNLYCKKDNLKVLDPCCGTGSFLICFSKKIKNPENIYGFDYDSLAVKLARLNIVYSYKNKDGYKINITNKNSLLDEIEDKFDLIFTNPPWGFMFSKEDQFKLKDKYPQITSGESYSYFILACFSLLNKKGILSFILPESILKIKTHKDIRDQILNNMKIKEIHYLGPIFNKVMANVVRLDLIKGISSKNKIKVNFLGKESVVEQEDFKKNQGSQFSIQKDSEDDLIISKIYSKPHFTLKDNSVSALGIVTGNNDKFLKSKKEDDQYEIIITGKNIAPFKFEPPYKYIKFEKDKFQQCADKDKFKVKEKLVYKFISKKLVFVLDTEERYTLNSANILIPQFDYSKKIICLFFNSKLYNFIFQKKFNSLKVLKSELESLPLPVLSHEQIIKLEMLYDSVLAGTTSIEEVDVFVFDIFSLTKENIEYVKNNTK